MSHPTKLSLPTGPLRPWIGGAVLVVVLALLPLLAIPGLGILPGPTYSPGSLHLMAYTMVIVAVTLSYHLLFGTAGLLSFGHSLYFGAGVYGIAMLLARTDLPFVVAAALVVVGALVLSNLVGSVALRVSGISFAMVTLAFAQAGNVLIRRNPAGSTGGDEGLRLNIANVPALFVGVTNVRNLYWLALAMVVAVYVVVAWIENTRAGHVIAATRENELRVRVLGGRPYLVKLLTFAVAGTLAAIAGIVFALLQSGAQHTTTSSEFTLTLLVIVVLGGVGKRWGAILGAVIYTMLDHRLVALATSPAIESLPAILRVSLGEPLFLLGTLFILTVLFLPGGIAGAIDRLRKKDDRTEALEIV